jgi:KaiC/GvpD/RAD55 family RecA-like ATPase
MQGASLEEDTMNKPRDENQRLHDGDLPENPEEGTVPVGADGKPIERLVSVADSFAELKASWDRPDTAVSTGFVQLDYMLSGGIRSGDMLALVGLAKAGKSALWGQALYQLAAKGALCVYASVEMPRDEVTCRWIAREMFLDAYQDNNSWAVSYSDVLYGKAHRGEGIQAEGQRARVKERLAAAMARVQDTGARLFVEHLAPGSTCGTLRSIVERAKEQTGHQGLTVLLVDPIQRLFAHDSESCEGRALERINAEETPRMNMVAQQLISLAQDKSMGMAVLFTSDTTKGAAFKQGADSSTDMRGTYMLNHAATAIFDVTSGALSDVCKMLAGGESAKQQGIDAQEDRIRHLPDMLMHRKPMAERLGSRVAYLNCSGNRRGPNGSAVFTFVPGAMTFAEADGLTAEALAGDPPAKPIKSPTKAKKGQRR